MKFLNIITWLALFLSILIIFSQSNAEQSQPISNIRETDQFLNNSDHWNHDRTHFQDSMLKKLASPMVLAAILCFIAAAISSAGGIGGGGLFIPVLTIVAGLDLKTASGFSAFMVTGGSSANVICHMFGPKFCGSKPLIDYDIALLSEPCMLLGVSIGVICNRVFPEWLITILFAIFLGWCTLKTCKNGFVHWRLESEDKVKGNCCGNLENGLVQNRSNTENEIVKSIKEPLLAMEVAFPWEKLGVLVLIWFTFSFLYLLRGNRYGEGFTITKACGVGYWVLSSLQIPLAIIFTSWILLRKGNSQNQTANLQILLVKNFSKFKFLVKEIDDPTRSRMPRNFVFPLMALLSGILGGVFGIGGGMLISPLLLHVGIPPKVTAATCSFMVFFSSTMSAFQYLLSGMDHTDTALIFAVVCFLASLVGLLVIQRTIKKHGRASIIVFSVSTVMALSTVLITSFGAIDVWEDYQSGTNMGFNLPC